MKTKDEIIKVLKKYASEFVDGNGELVDCFIHLQYFESIASELSEPEVKTAEVNELGKLINKKPDKTKVLISPSKERIMAFVNNEWMQFTRDDISNSQSQQSQSSKTAEEIFNRFCILMNKDYNEYIIKDRKGFIDAIKFASQFQEQPITVTDIEKVVNEYIKTELPDANKAFHYQAEIAFGLKEFAKWALSLKAQKAQPSNEDIKEWALYISQINFSYSFYDGLIDGAKAMRDGLIPKASNTVTMHDCKVADK